MRSVLRFWVLGILSFPFAITPIALLPSGTLADPCPIDYPAPIAWHVIPAQPCDGDSLRLVFESCGPCVDLLGARFIRTGRPSLLVTARMDLSQCIIARICKRDSVSVDLGQFRSGSYKLQFLIQTEVVREDSSVCSVTQVGSAAFEVGRCQPPPGPLPYVDDIVVGERVVCIRYPCPDLACPHDSIPVFVRGTFPDDCFILRRIEYVPSIETVIGPPTLRILVDDMGCLGRPCAAVPVPWSATVLLPPLPPGDYNLPVELSKVTCQDSFPGDTVYSTLRAFHVTEQCSIPSRTCLRVSWGDHPVAHCDAVISPGRPARVSLQIAPSVALAGLQGDLVLDRSPLRITDIEAIGYASGMHLDWNVNPSGARFVLFAENGAPIPPYLLRNLGSWPVLRITLEQPSGVTVPSETRLFATNLLGSDSTGIGVYECFGIEPFLPTAVICARPRCDLNADGSADVRDLVLMVHCVQDAQSCPDSSAVDLDCDASGTVELEDVLCCARFILNGDIPDSTGGRPEAGVQVGFGQVRRTETVVEVPLTLHGADRVGAARLALRYPADRFDVIGVEFPSSPGWLHLFEVRDGNIVIGLIGTSGTSGGSDVVEMVVRLAVKTGQSSGGEVRVVESQFSGPDGIGLEVDLGQPKSPLPAVAPLSLTPGQPNPFSGTTRFAVELAAAGDLEVTVHDLSGRRVRWLIRERAAAGTRESVWDGRRENGSAAPSGVYFIRARVPGRTVSSRVVLLRDH